MPSVNSCEVDLIIITDTPSKICCCNTRYYLWANIASVSEGSSCHKAAVINDLPCVAECPSMGTEPCARRVLWSGVHMGTCYQCCFLGHAGCAKVIPAGNVASQDSLKNISAFSIKAFGQKPESHSAVSIPIKRKKTTKKLTCTALGAALCH